MNQDLLNKFAAAYHIQPTEAALFQLANTHRYGCNCDVCLFWWASVGAEENGRYGPFAAWEIAAARKENNEA